MYTKVILLIAVLCVVFPAIVQQEGPAHQPVSLSLIVTDKDGKGLNTIRKDQVRLFEDKAEQTILSIEADERPVDYALLIDATGSFARLFASALEAAKLFIINRRPQDQVAIVRFVNSGTIEAVQRFSGDGDALLKALDKLYVGKGQSALIDALYLSTQYVAEHNKSNDGRRKVVVVITDGEDRISYYKPEQLVKLLRETGVQVFAVGLIANLDHDQRFHQPTPRQRAVNFLTTVADESGGRLFLPETREELSASAAQILLDLRAQFRIKYQSTNDASKKGFRKVEVRFVSTDGEKRNLIVPRRYYVGPKTPPGKNSEKKS